MRRETAGYRRARAALLEGGPACVYCGRLATTADHVPPLAAFPDPDLWDGQLVPACLSCNSSQGASYGNRRRGRRRPSRRW